MPKFLGPEVILDLCRFELPLFKLASRCREGAGLEGELRLTRREGPPRLRACSGASAEAPQRPSCRICDLRPSASFPTSSQSFEPQSPISRLSISISISVSVSVALIGFETPLGSSPILFLCKKITKFYFVALSVVVVEVVVVVVFVVVVVVVVKLSVWLPRTICCVEGHSFIFFSFF